MKKPTPAEIGVDRIPMGPRFLTPEWKEAILGNLSRHEESPSILDRQRFSSLPGIACIDAFHGGCEAPARILLLVDRHASDLIYERMTEICALKGVLTVTIGVGAVRGGQKVKIETEWVEGDVSIAGDSFDCVFGYLTAVLAQDCEESRCG